MATEQTIISYSLTLTAAAKVTVFVSGKHDYANISGSKPWQLALYGNGQLVKAVGGSGAYTETPILQAMFTVSSAATITLRVTWYGDSSMTLASGTALTPIVSYK